MTESIKPSDQSGDYIPFSERFRNKPRIRHLAELHPEEYDVYLSVALVE